MTDTFQFSIKKSDSVSEMLGNHLLLNVGIVLMKGFLPSLEPIPQGTANQYNQR
jgi:hypothetical protein